MISTLYDYQEAAIERLRIALSNGSLRPLLQAPTGAGKTVIAASVVEMALAKAKRVAFCVPAIELIDQTIRAFYDEGITQVGVIQANHHMTDWVKPIQVCSVQSVSRRSWPRVDLVIIDEAHRRFKAYEKWMRECPQVPFVGLSATPWTKGLGHVYSDLIVAATTKELIARGKLAPFKVYAPSRPDLTGVRTTGGDYNEGDLDKVRAQDALTADVIGTWLKLGKGRPTVCFAVNRAHAEQLQLRFEEHGVTAGYIDCFTPRDERDRIRMKFHAGLLEVVCNVDCLGIGVDWDIRCVILARPTKSEIRFVQNVGRGLRTADGKDHCLILDHSDTHLRLGFVTDIHHDRLDSRKLGELKNGKKEVRLPRLCAKCAYLMPITAQACPSCGYAQPKIEIKEANGELAEFNGERVKRRENRTWDHDTKLVFYQELIGYAQGYGYKNGWAAHKYRERFGVWPNALGHPSGRSPSVNTLNWIRSRNIAWAKSKGNGEGA